MGKRKNKKGKTEYLVRWRGYGSDGDTWEPESHLTTCMVYVHDFNRQHAECHRDGVLLRSTRSSPHLSPVHRLPCRPPAATGGRSDNILTGDCTQARCNDPPLSPAHLPDTGRSCYARMGLQQPLLADRFSSSGAVAASGGPMAPSAAGLARRSVDLAKTGIKILVPKSPMNSRVDSEESPSEAAHSLEAGAHEAHSVPPEVALLEKPTGVLLGPGEERARMGTRPRIHSQNLLPPPRAPVTPAAMRSLNCTGQNQNLSSESKMTLSIRFESRDRVPKRPIKI